MDRNKIKVKLAMAYMVCPSGDGIKQGDLRAEKWVSENVKDDCCYHATHLRMSSRVAGAEEEE